MTTPTKSIAVPRTNDPREIRKWREAVAWWLINNYDGVVLAEWWGAKGDGSTDDSLAIQAAIDYLADLNGGTVQLLDKAYKCNITLKSYVTIRGIEKPNFTAYLNGVERTNKTTLIAASGGSVVDSPTSALNGACLEKLTISGLGAGTSCIGLRLREHRRCSFKDLAFDYFADQAIYIEDGNASEFVSIIAINSLLDRSRAAKIGVIDIVKSADNLFDRIEVTTSQTSLTDSNLYLCAWNFGAQATTNFVRDCVGEISDVGFHVAGDWNGFVNCRADLNYGHGFEIPSGASSNRFIGCFAFRNSQETDNTYNGFDIATGTTANIFVGCFSSCISSDSNKQKYGFYDNVGAVNDKNTYTGCYGRLNGTALFYGATYLGSSYLTLGVNEFTDDDATPSVVAGHFFWFNGYTQATDITDFDDGTPGQVIHVVDKQADGYVTIKNNANISTSTGADIILSQNKVYTFIMDNGVWRYMT